MFLKAKLSWNVVIPPKSLYQNDLKLKTEVSRSLLSDFATQVATKDLGYFLAVTTVNTIGDGLVRPSTGEVEFPVAFNCITFKLFGGEIIEAVVVQVMKHGAFLRCGPVENVFLSANKIPDYHFVADGEDSVIVNPKKPNSSIAKGVTVRCVVVSSQWREEEKELRAVVDLPSEVLAKFT